MEPNRRRMLKRMRHAAASHTTIASLYHYGDVFANILLRLPSLASLARAALASPWWRDLATSRDFLLNFRALHPSPPLLGCFVSFVSSDGAAYSDFHRAQICSDRDLAAAVRGGDFLLTGLEVEHQWRIRDCRHGLLLLASNDQFALFNPVSRRCINIQKPTHRDQFDNDVSFHSCLLPACGGNDVQMASFRLVSLEIRECNNGKRVCAHVYNSDTGQWSFHPAPLRIKVPPPRRNQDQSSYPSMHAAGRIYWKYQSGNVLLSLDTAPGGSMKFSRVDLPPVPELHLPQAPYVVGDTEGGTCCLVCVVKDPPGGRSRTLQVWTRNEEAKSWELQTEVNQSSMFDCSRVELEKVIQVCAVTMGVVVLSFYHGSERYRYVAFRLKNLCALGAGDATKLPLEADFITCRGLAAYPYLMAWPPPILLQQPPRSSESLDLVARPETGHDKTTVVFPSAVQLDREEWVLDTGALMHYTSNPRLLLDFQEIADAQPPSGDDGHHILGRGSVRTERFKVPDVRYIRGDATRNIISVTQLAHDYDLVTVFGPRACHVKDEETGQIVGKGLLRNGIYVLDYLLISQYNIGGQGGRGGSGAKGEDRGQGQRDTDDSGSGAGGGHGGQGDRGGGGRAEGGRGGGRGGGGEEEEEGERQEDRRGEKGEEQKQEGEEEEEEDKEKEEEEKEEEEEEEDEKEEQQESDERVELEESPTTAPGGQPERRDRFGLSRFDWRPDEAGGPRELPIRVGQGCYAFLAFASSHNRSGAYIVDSAATHHMTGDKDLVRSSYMATHDPKFPRDIIRQVDMANGTFSPVRGVGNVDTNEIKLDDVLHVEDLTVNLVSVSQLLDQLARQLEEWFWKTEVDRQLETRAMSEPDRPVDEVARLLKNMHVPMFLVDELARQIRDRSVRKNEVTVFARRMQDERFTLEQSIVDGLGGMGLPELLITEIVGQLGKAEVTRPQIDELAGRIFEPQIMLNRRGGVSVTVGNLVVGGSARDDNNNGLYCLDRLRPCPRVQPSVESDKWVLTEVP